MILSPEACPLLRAVPDQGISEVPRWEAETPDLDITDPPTGLWMFLVSGTGFQSGPPVMATAWPAGRGRRWLPCPVRWQKPLEGGPAASIFETSEFLGKENPPLPRFPPQKHWLKPR